jgi:hypothetical protein
MDFADEQQKDGGITEMAPYMGIAIKAMVVNQLHLDGSWHFIPATKAL